MIRKDYSGLNTPGYRGYPGLTVPRRQDGGSPGKSPESHRKSYQ